MCVKVNTQWHTKPLAIEKLYHAQLCARYLALCNNRKRKHYQLFNNCKNPIEREPKHPEGQQQKPEQRQKKKCQ
jgi:hypothetical protein